MVPPFLRPVVTGWPGADPPCLCVVSLVDSTPTKKPPNQSYEGNSQPPTQSNIPSSVLGVNGMWVSGRFAERFLVGAGKIRGRVL